MRFGDLAFRTVGQHPLEATFLHMACKQKWRAKGCQPFDQFWAVDHLLHLGADPHALSSRGDTVLMEVAGAGHVNMFNYLCHRTKRRNTPFDLMVTNKDGRNLWSIAGLAHDPKEGLRKHVNEDIKNMVMALARHKFMEPHGLATRSSAARGIRPRVEDILGYGARCQFPDASSSEPPPC